jgi:hypothetical protein
MHRRLLALCLFGAALAAAALPARAESDAVQFFTNIEVTPDNPVQDAVCFFCNVYLNGKVEGDVVVMFGNIRLNGTAPHDVVSLFGNVTAGDGAQVGGDLVSIFGSVRLGNNVSVGQDLVCIFGDLRKAGSVTVGGDRVTIPGLVLYAPLLVLVLLIWLLVYELRTRRERQMMAQGYPLPPGR